MAVRAARAQRLLAAVVRQEAVAAESPVGVRCLHTPSTVCRSGSVQGLFALSSPAAAATCAGVLGSQSIAEGFAASAHSLTSFRTKRGKAKGKAKSEPKDVSDDEEIHKEWDLGVYESSMQKAVDYFMHELNNIRPGRATPTMLDHLKVEAYGEKMSLISVATMTCPNPRTLAITPFDPSTFDAIETAIRESPLELEPQRGEESIMVHVPAPTSDALKKMTKVVKSEANSAKDIVRKARRAGTSDVKGIECEDTRKMEEKALEKLFDRFIAEIDDVAEAKEAEILKP